MALGKPGLKDWLGAKDLHRELGHCTEAGGSLVGNGNYQENLK